MAGRTSEDEALLQDAEREWKERTEPKKKGGRYVDAAYPNAGSRVRFGAKRGFEARREYDDLVKKPAPGPAGPPMSEMQAEAARRRREQRERERGR